MSSIAINIFNLKINSVGNASAVNIGQNLLADWVNSDKSNNGFGTNSGDQFDIMGNRMLVDDRDAIDAPTEKNALPFTHLISS